MRYEELSKLKKQLSMLKSERMPLETIWDNITDFVVPNRPKFAARDVPSTRRDLELYDSTAVFANEFLAATIHGGLTNPSTKWFILRPKNKELLQDSAVVEFLDNTTELMFDVLNDPSTGFQSNHMQLLVDLTAYGTACLSLTYDVEAGQITYKTIHLSELFIGEDKNDQVDTIYRKFEFTARQAEQKWGLKNLPDNMKEAVENAPHQKFCVIHCVKPYKEYYGKKSNKFPYASVYFSEDSDHVFDEGGFTYLPYLVVRLSKLTGESYGRSPARSALADINKLQVMAMTAMEAGQLFVRPPLMIPDDGVISSLDTGPGGTIIGGVDSMTYQPLVHPLNVGARPDVFDKLLESAKQDIYRAFYVNSLLFRDGPQMTAEEVRTRSEEQLRLLGPQVGRLQQEYLGKLIQTSFQLLEENNLLPPLDPYTADDLGQGGMSIEYSSPLAKTQRAQELFGMQRLMEMTMQVAQLDPKILDVFNYERQVRFAADVLSVPFESLNTPEEIQLIQQERAQQQQAMMQAQMAQQQGQANLANAQAGQIEQGGPQ